MHMLQYYGKKVEHMLVYRDDMSTVGMQSICDNHLQYWSQINDYMELGELVDHCGNERTEVDCDISQDDVSDDMLVDCNILQDSV